MTVRVDETVATIRRPDLLGAVISKASAASLPTPEKHLRDLALLLTLVEDPRTMQRALRRKDRQVLRWRRQLLEPSHPAWLGIQNAQRGRAALMILLGDPPAGA